MLWKLDTLAHSSIADPVTALVFGAAAPVTLSLVDGKPVVEGNHLTTVDEDAIARVHAGRGPAPRADRRRGLTLRTDVRPGGTALGRPPWTRAGSTAAVPGGAHRRRARRNA